jgi:cell division protease FtsH
MANGDAQPPSNQPNKPGTPPPNMRVSRMLYWMIFLGGVMLLFVFMSQSFSPPNEIRIDQFNSLVDSGKVKKIVLRDGRIEGELKDDVKIEGSDKAPISGKFEVKYPPQAMDGDFMRDLETRSDAEIIRKDQGLFFQVMIALLPWLLFFGVIYFLFFRQLRNVGGGAGMLGNFGRSRHRVSTKEHTNITFADVAGIQEAQEEVGEIIEFLKSPKKFQRLGGRIPRGVLLVGLPGCGKTLLAKAIAGEADVPFFSISGSDFVEMFVGVGASRVRDLFKQAKDNSPCIVFLDEIDAVGRRRGASFAGGGHDEREQTLNAILVEMDGFDSNDQVIVIAATNRVDVLDPALIRPGRFDRQVYVPLPDVQGRYEILKVHARKIKLGPNVDMRRLARSTPTFSGADLAAIINESALIATMAAKDYVEMDDLEEARDKVRWGRAKRSRVVDDWDRKVTAYHEAGHALVQAMEKDADPLHKVSIIPRGEMGGATFSLPERDRIVYGKRYLVSMLKVCFGGRLAEEMFCEDVSNGASMDIKQATSIARSMVKDWGMTDKLGFVFYGEEPSTTGFDFGGREYSDKTAQEIDDEVRRIVEEAYQATKKLMQEYRTQIEAIAEALIKYETLSGDEVHALIRGETLDKPSVSDLLDDDKSKSADSFGRARPVSNDPGHEMGGGALPQPS